MQYRILSDNIINKKFISNQAAKNVFVDEFTNTFFYKLFV